MKRQVLYAPTEPAFFIPFRQHPDASIRFIARTQLDPRDVLPLMRETVGSLDRDLVVENATTVAGFIAQSTENERYRALLMSVFGILATLLAAAGLLGMTARSFAWRRREMGIKMALGAQRSGLVGTAVRDVLFTSLAGTAVGFVGALLASRLLRRLLFRIEPWDPTTYGVVFALILIVCLLSSYVPARRISRVNPVDVLRAELDLAEPFRAQRMLIVNC